jgi:MFS superfamily sulfate permease-like transporter
VALTGAIPASLPTFTLPLLEPGVWRDLLGDAAGIMLISFTGGMLSAQSFARRTGEGVDADTDLVAGGVANIVAGLTQGFAVAGTDSRTAVNIAAGARTQLSVIVAALAMLAALFMLSGPLAMAPAPVFGAVVLVAVLGLFDIAGLRRFWAMSRREALISAATTLGVVVLGVLPGVLLAVGLSLVWLLAMALRPTDAILGRVPGLPGHHDVTHHADALTTPGLLLYRFESNIVFFNADRLASRLLAALDTAQTPVRWVVVDLAPVSLVDATAVMRLDELRTEVAKRGVTLAVAAARTHLARAFSERWAVERVAGTTRLRFPTLDAATAAFIAAQDTEVLTAGETVDGQEE